MSEQHQAEKTRYKEARDAFDDLSVEDRATFLIEATFSTLVRGLEKAGDALARTVEQAFEEAREAGAAAEEPGATEPPTEEPEDGEPEGASEKASPTPKASDKTAAADKKSTAKKSTAKKSTAKKSSTKKSTAKKKSTKDPGEEAAE